MPLMIASSLRTSRREQSEKSVPFGYHLRTSRLQFSTDFTYRHSWRFFRRLSALTIALWLISLIFSM